MACRKTVPGSVMRRMKLMIRRLLILCLLLSLSASLMAQKRFFPSRPRNDAALYEGPVYGVKGGVNMPRLSYTDPQLKSLSPDLILTPSASLFIEFPFLRPCTVAPEISYQRKGGSFSYLYVNQYKETYSLYADYILLRCPVYFYMPVTDRVKPYVFLSPDLGIVFSGAIALMHPNHDQPDYHAEINLSNYRYAYLGALGGMGVRFNLPLSLITIVLKLDAAVNWGFFDTYANHEHIGIAIPVNVNAYHIQGNRYLRGLEVHLSLGYFINKPDACGGFQ